MHGIFWILVKYKKPNTVFTGSVKYVIITFYHWTYEAVRTITFYSEELWVA